MLAAGGLIATVAAVRRFAGRIAKRSYERSIPE
jgi:hypothetical protein